MNIFDYVLVAAIAIACLVIMYSMLSTGRKRAQEGRRSEAVGAIVATVVVLACNAYAIYAYIQVRKHADAPTEAHR